MEAALSLVPSLPDDFSGEFTEANFQIVMRRLAELEATVREQQSELTKARTRRSADDLEDELAGHLATIRKQSRALGAAERKLREYDDNPDTHPQGHEITELIDRWRVGTNKPTAKIGSGRVRLTKARIADGFKIRTSEGEDPEPTLELAVDGLCAYPYRVFDRRFAEGNRSDLDNDFSRALKDEKHVEELSRYGYRARKAGWTPSGKWPA